MTSRYHLTRQELDALELEHRHAPEKRYADRIKTVYPAPQNTSPFMARMSPAPYYALQGAG